MLLVSLVCYIQTYSMVGTFIMYCSLQQITFTCEMSRNVVTTVITLSQILSWWSITHYSILLYLTDASVLLENNQCNISLILTSEDIDDVIYIQLYYFLHFPLGNVNTKCWI